MAGIGDSGPGNPRIGEILDRIQDFYRLLEGIWERLPGGLRRRSRGFRRRRSRSLRLPFFKGRG